VEKGEGESLIFRYRGVPKEHDYDWQTRKEKGEFPYARYQLPFIADIGHQTGSSAPSRQGERNTFV